VANLVVVVLSTLAYFKRRRREENFFQSSSSTHRELVCLRALVLFERTTTRFFVGLCSCCSSLMFYD
jgi:hypothetical protein